MIEPPVWTPERLAELRAGAVSTFRAERLAEPVEVYPDQLEHAMSLIETLLESTVDLKRLETADLVDLITGKDGLAAFRYIASPPISEDDLKVLADVQSLAPSRLKADPEIVRRLASVVINCLDRHRFSWIIDEREPDEAERKAAIIASATLLACQRVETNRRSISKREQERTTKEILEQNGFVEVSRRQIRTSHEAPRTGEFCGESVVGQSRRGRKADFAVGLWDGRLLLVECKVSNSETNSIKRLNNDVVSKALNWVQSLGSENVIASAMLSGVYKQQHLQNAQALGLILFWAHDPSTLSDWLAKVRANRE